MSEGNSAHQDAIEKLERLQAGESVSFTEAEVEALREVALWWVRFKGAFAIGGILGSAFKWFLLFAAAIAATKAGLIEWLSGGGQQ